MAGLSQDLLLDASAILPVLHVLAKFAIFTFIHYVVLRYLMVDKRNHDSGICQDTGDSSSSDMVEDVVDSTMPISDYLSEGITESLDALVCDVVFQLSEPVTPTTDDGADYPLFEHSSDGGSSEADLDVREAITRPRAISAPSQSQRCVQSESDCAPYPTRNRSNTVSTLFTLKPCERQVNGILNKMTRERFDSLYQQLLSICSGEGFNQEVINVVARGVFTKATVQHTFAEMYAEICSKLYSDFATQAAKPGVAVEFKRSLLEQCQNSFEVYLQPPPVDSSLNEEEQFEQLTKYKTKMLGNVRLIAHLIRQKILSSNIIFDCTNELLEVGSGETLESLCVFVSTLGDFLHAPEWHTHVQVLVLFSRIRLLSEDLNQSSRIRFLMKNVLEKRSNSRSERVASPPPASNDVTSLPVLLGRTASVRGGADAAASKEMHKEPDNTRDESSEEMDHSNLHTQKANEKRDQCDKKPGHAVSLTVALDVQRTPLRATASCFQPSISNQEEAVVADPAPKTSIMLRNIPVFFSRSAVLDLLRSEGFADQISFVYVPMNLRSNGNFGYAFVDFDSMGTAERCKGQLEGFTRWAEPSEKAMEVSWSDTQGLDAQIARYRDSPLMHESVADEMKPALYNNGLRIAFPAPTKAIKAPRLRKVVEPVESNTQ